jgi:hypothetical protein
MKNYMTLKNQKNLGRMAQVICLFFVIFSSDVFAQTIRPTTFDSRNICENSKGVWRQFGNGCADNCEAKFDRFNICTQALAFSCDCGKNRCWNGDACVSMSEYKKVYDVEQEKSQKLLDEAKEKRKADATANKAAIMARFLPKDENGNPIQPAQNVATNPSLPEPQKPNDPEIPTSPITVITPDRITEIQPQEEQVKSEDLDKKVELPPFILKKIAKEEAEKQQNEQQKKVEDSKPLIEKSLPPGLPVIPLPN